MNFLRSIRADLVDKRLLPVVIVLAALAVLVPLASGLLGGSASSQPVIAPPPAVAPTGAASPARALAAVAGPGTPAPTHFSGRELDPFRQRASAVAAQAAAGSPKTAAGAVAPPAAAKPATGAAKPPTTAAAKPPTKTPVKVIAKTRVKPTTKAPVKAAPPPPPRTPSPKAQLAKLTSRDSYSVDIKVADETGRRSLAGVKRLRPLPLPTNPLVEYFGVLKSGRAATFLVNPGTVAQGPGLCLPHAGDCQVLLLKPGQLEVLAVRTGGAPVIQASIAVAGWRVVTHASVAAARKARAQEVKQGRTLVSQSAQPALSDLVYTVAQGAVSLFAAILKALPAAG